MCFGRAHKVGYRDMSGSISDDLALHTLISSLLAVSRQLSFVISASVECWGAYLAAWKLRLQYKHSIYLFVVSITLCILLYVVQSASRRERGKKKVIASYDLCNAFVHVAAICVLVLPPGELNFRIVSCKENLHRFH